jgi:hypothetical protein
MSMILTDRILKEMPSLAGGKMLHPLGAVQRPDDVTAIGLGLDHKNIIRGAGQMIQLRHAQQVRQQHVMKRGNA